MTPSRRSLLAAFLALPVASRFKPWVRPPRDDTAFIQGLIDAAVARGESIVHIPAGRYRIGALPAVVPKSITCLRGAGAGRTVFYGDRLPP